MYSNFGLLQMRPTEALIKFCKAINPYENIYHANFILDEMERIFLDNKRTKKHGSGDRWCQKIKGRIDRCYEKAINLHLSVNPSGPLPTRIFCGHTYRGVTIGKWKGKTMLELFVPYKKLLAPSILIRSNEWSEIVHYSQLFGIPSPPSLGFANVRVPLGELLDFLDKYR